MTSGFRRPTVLYFDVINGMLGTLIGVCMAACKWEYWWNIHFHNNKRQKLENIYA